MVELDCYEGEGDEIVITHGYTLVDNVNLDDILVELKETAFINSDLPVILSIENHLGNHHQEIMINKLKKHVIKILRFIKLEKDKRKQGRKKRNGGKRLFTKKLGRYNFINKNVRDFGTYRNRCRQVHGAKPLPGECLFDKHPSVI